MGKSMEKVEGEGGGKGEGGVRNGQEHGEGLG